MATSHSTYPNGRLEESFKAPLWVTLVFVVTMLAIYFMGRSVSNFYEMPLLPQGVENTQ